MASVAFIFVTWVARSYGKKNPPPPFVLFFFGGQIVFFLIDAVMISNSVWYTAHKSTTARYVFLAQIAYVLCMLPFSPKQKAAQPPPTK
jgi:hypothetical protein